MDNEDLFQGMGSEDQIAKGDFSLGPFLELDLTQFQIAVADITQDVVFETKVEKELTEVSRTWEDYKFSFEKWSPVFGGAEEQRVVLQILVQVPDCLELLESHVATINQLISSKNAKHFLKQLRSEKALLKQIVETLELWLSVQEDCLTLGRVLLGQIRGQNSGLEELINQFEDDFKQYSKMMNTVVKKPIVKHCCLSDQRRNELNHFQDVFVKHQMACRTLIEKRRKILPRLNFLSFQEALVIAGGVKDNEQKFIKATTKLLASGVDTIVFKSDRITAIKTMNDEELVLKKEISLTEETTTVEDCLCRLIAESKVALKQTIDLQMIRGKKFHDFDVEDYMSCVQQAALVQFECLWNDNVEEALQKPNASESFRLSFIEMTSKLQKLVQQLRNESLSNKDFKKMTNFLYKSLSKRGYFYDFIRMRIQTSSDFNWLSFPRTHWSIDTLVLTVRQGLANLSYGYEFQSVDNLPLATEGMRRCQLSMSTAIANCRPIFVRGQGINGKTTAMIDLIRRLGRYFVRHTLTTGKICPIPSQDKTVDLIMLL